MLSCFVRLATAPARRTVADYWGATDNDYDYARFTTDECYKNSWLIVTDRYFIDKKVVTSLSYQKDFLPERRLSSIRY